MFHCFLIWPLIVGLCPLEVLKRKCLFLLLLLFNFSPFLSVIPLFDILPNVYHPQHFCTQHIKSLMNFMKHDEYVDLKIRISMFHCFLISPFIAGLCPFEVLNENFCFRYSS